SGQSQKWTLFAPTIARECVFPALDLCWDDETKLVLSENEPADLGHYFRAGNYRLRRYERNLTLALFPEQGETRAQTAERWRDEIRGFVTDNAGIREGYLRWRTNRTVDQWPSRSPPRAVVLLMRRYHISDSSEAPRFWTGPHSVPI